MTSPRLLAALLALCPVVAACGGDPSAPITPSPPAPASPFARLLDSLRSAHDLPALAGAIVTADSVPSLDAVGFRMAGTTRLVTRDDKFHLGSVLKHQTSVLVARLVTDGKLSWTRTLAEYFPEERATMRPEYAGVNLRDLLSHSAGLVRDPAIPNVPLDARAARAAIVKTVLTLAPIGAVGSYSYSNTGYMVAGAIVERALGQPFESVMQQLLWATLGMSSAGWGAAGTDAVDQPVGHVVDANRVRTAILPSQPGADNPVQYGPAGRAHMSLVDWARFTSALLRAESGRDTPLLSAASWKALTTGHVATAGSDSYGYGLGVTSRSWAGGRALWHDGSNTRNYALTWIAPGRNFAVLLATNQYSPSVGAQLDAGAFRLIQFWQTGR